MSDIKKPFYKEVADKLIDQLEKGVAPWQRGWTVTGRPYNVITGKNYRGANVLNLALSGREDPRWMTYKQAQTLGAQVKKGERGTKVQYWIFEEMQTIKDENGKPRLDHNGKEILEKVRLERPKVINSVVFNAEQIDGLPPLQKKSIDVWDSIDKAEQILKNSGANIEHKKQDQAYYQASTDKIVLPLKEQFEKPEFYYGTALHELGHWTGHSTRLNRDLTGHFGGEKYAREELRAEISSMMLEMEVGIPHDTNRHASYVQSWVAVLKSDPAEIIRASSDAEKIKDFVLSLSQEQKIELNKQQDETTELNLSILARVNDMENSNKTYISVPFKEKEEAKALGAKWDRGESSWYIPENLDKEAFSKWMNKENVRVEKNNSEKTYLVVPFKEKEEAKALGAKWDKSVKSWYISGVVTNEMKKWLPENNPVQQDPALSPREEFSIFMKDMGLVVSGEHPIMDGKLHRVRTENDKSKDLSGAYILHGDGLPAGYVQNFKTGEKQNWKSKGYHFSSNELARMRAEAAQKLQEREKDIMKKHEEISQKLTNDIHKLSSVKADQVYLVKKDIQVHKGVYEDKYRNMVIPAYDENGKIWANQTIYPDGNKRFTAGGKKEGNFHVIGGLDELNKSNIIIIAEGYATASTITEATKIPVVAAFDSGNLKIVSEKLHQKYPDKPIIIAGDDDHHRTLENKPNVGRIKAEEAAKNVNGVAVFPIFPSNKIGLKSCTDFNDLARESNYKLDSVKKIMTSTIDSIKNRDNKIFKEKTIKIKR